MRDMHQPDALDLDALVVEVTARIEAAANPERRRAAASYTPTAMRVLGTKVPSVRVVVRDVAKRVKNESAGTVLSLAEALVAAGIFEVRHVGYEVLSRHRTAMASVWAKESITGRRLIRSPRWSPGRSGGRGVSQTPPCSGGPGRRTAGGAGPPSWLPSP